MSRGLFVEVFGDLFEHTPAVAERAHANGLTTAEDTRDGLHAALVAAMHGLSADEETALIAAHPDLAGRLALAGDLTAASTSEQASAGLDKLTPDEKSRFTALNAAYRGTFGFPFIIAVRGLTTEDILTAFARRLNHDKATERAEALDQIARIARLRLDAIPLGGP